MNMSLWSIDGADWFVEGIPIAFWRSSRWAKNLYPFWMAKDDDQLMQLTKEAISSDKIAFWLDKLSGRQNGYHKALIKVTPNSDTRRKFMYATDLLISGIIKHDVGQKGLISVAKLPEDWRNIKPESSSINNRNYYDDLVQAPMDDNLLLVDISKSTQTDNISKKYELAVDPSFRIELSSVDLSQMKNVAKIVAQNIGFQRNFMEPKAIMFAIDAMKINGGWDFFEIHVPGRSLGIHLLPLVWVNNFTSVATMNSLHSFVDNISKEYGRIYLEKNEHETEFHKLEDICYGWIESMSSVIDSSETKKNVGIISDVSKKLEIDSFSIGNWMDRYYFRNLVENNLHPSKTAWKLIRKGDYQNVEKAFSELGPWLVAKPRNNYPWWYPDRIPVQVVYENSDHMKKRLQKMLMKDDFILEPLNLHSVDKYFCSGEIRTFWAFFPK